MSSTTSIPRNPGDTLLVIGLPQAPATPATATGENAGSTDMLEPAPTKKRLGPGHAAELALSPMAQVQQAQNQMFVALTCGLVGGFGVASALVLLAAAYVH